MLEFFVRRSKRNWRSHMHKNWPLTSCRRIVTSQDDVTAKLISNLFWVSLTWRNCIFAWLTKIATELSLCVTHQWFCKWGRQDTNLSKLKRILTKYFIHFKLESFFKLFTSFWYTLYIVGTCNKSIKYVRPKVKINKFTLGVVLRKQSNPTSYPPPPIFINASLTAARSRRGRLWLLTHETMHDLFWAI